MHLEGLEKAGPAFKFCPSCGRLGILSEDGRLWRCPSCGFLYFHNVAASAGLILESAGSVLLLRRAKEPRRGLLALPGGFADPGEGLEDCARRECAEEIGWAPARLGFVGSFPNLYEYAGLPYATCDAFFAADLGDLGLEDLRIDPGEVAGVELAPLAELPWAELAFGSTASALDVYIRARAGAKPAGG